MGNTRVGMTIKTTRLSVVCERHAMAACARRSQRALPTRLCIQHAIPKAAATAGSFITRCCCCYSSRIPLTEASLLAVGLHAVRLTMLSTH